MGIVRFAAGALMSILFSLADAVDDLVVCCVCHWGFD
jgi:hypothetical protein